MSERKKDSEGGDKKYLIDAYEEAAKNAGMPVRVKDVKALPTTEEAIRSEMEQTSDAVKKVELGKKLEAHRDPNSREVQLEKLALDASDHAIAEDVKRRQAERRSLVDPLTELPNRRYMDGALDIKLAEVRRYKEGSNRPFFMMVDVDHFKQINDKYGHKVGDFVLKKLAEKLGEAARVNDIVGRYGGEEFFVLALCVDEEGALVFADRIMELVRDTKFRCTTDGREVPDGKHADVEIDDLTISIGVSEHSNGMDKNELVERADAALYASKSTGRNRVTVVNDDILTAARVKAAGERG